MAAYGQPEIQQRANLSFPQHANVEEQLKFLFRVLSKVQQEEPDVYGRALREALQESSQERSQQMLQMNQRKLLLSSLSETNIVSPVAQGTLASCYC